jgi:hypothetical protein
MKAKGKKPDFANVAGEDVEGLYSDKCLNVYYFYTIDPTTKKKNKVTRRNKAKAALDLYNYKLQFAGQDFTKVFLDTEDDEDGGKILKSSDDKSYIIPAAMPDKEQVKFKDKDGYECSIITNEVFNVPNNFIIERFVEMLDVNPREISEIFIKMGREDLVGIIHLPKNYKRSKTELSKMLEWYLTEEERSRDTIRYGKLFWGQFCDIVNVPYLEQITLNHIKIYKQQLKSIRTKKKLSHKWLNYRYELVRRVVRHAKLHVENKSYINDVLDNMEILKATGGKDNNRKNPKPISKEEFQLMLNYFKAELKKANTPSKKVRYSKWVALFLTAANTCSYFQDICDMTLAKKSGHLGLDLNGNTLTMYREKKSTVKVAVLWNETVDAIKLFRKYQNCQTDYVFETKKNKKNTASRLRDEFWRYVRPKIANQYNNKELLKIEFNQIRDAGFTACAIAGLHIEQRNYVSGHRNTGDDDAYLLRQPKLAKPACDAIYSYFFGENSNF